MTQISCKDLSLGLKNKGLNGVKQFPLKVLNNPTILFDPGLNGDMFSYCPVMLGNYSSDFITNSILGILNEARRNPSKNINNILHGSLNYLLICNTFKTKKALNKMQIINRLELASLLNDYKNTQRLFTNTLSDNHLAVFLKNINTDQNRYDQTGQLVVLILSILSARGSLHLKFVEQKFSQENLGHLVSRLWSKTNKEGKSLLLRLLLLLPLENFKSLLPMIRKGQEFSKLMAKELMIVFKLNSLLYNRNGTEELPIKEPHFDRVSSLLSILQDNRLLALVVKELNIFEIFSMAVLKRSIHAAIIEAVQEPNGLLSTLSDIETTFLLASLQHDIYGILDKLIDNLVQRMDSLSIAKIIGYLNSGKYKEVIQSNSAISYENSYIVAPNKNITGAVYRWGYFDDSKNVVRKKIARKLIKYNKMVEVLQLVVQQDQKHLLAFYKSIKSDEILNKTFLILITKNTKIPIEQLPDDKFKQYITDAIEEQRLFRTFKRAISDKALEKALILVIKQNNPSLAQTMAIDLIEYWVSRIEYYLANDDRNKAIQALRNRAYPQYKLLIPKFDKESILLIQNKLRALYDLLGVPVPLGFNKEVFVNGEKLLSLADIKGMLQLNNNAMGVLELLEAGYFNKVVKYILPKLKYSEPKTYSLLGLALVYIEKRDSIDKNLAQGNIKKARMRYKRALGHVDELGLQESEYGSQILWVLDYSLKSIESR